MATKKKTKQKRVSVNISPDSLEAAKVARPDAFEQGLSHGVDLLMCEGAGIDPPLSPKDRMAAAGRKATGKAKRPKNLKGGRKKKGDRE